MSSVLQPLPVFFIHPPSACLSGGNPLSADSARTLVTAALASSTLQTLNGISLKNVKTEGHTLRLSGRRLEDGDMNLVFELAEALGKTEIHLGKFKVTGGGTI